MGRMIIFRCRFSRMMRLVVKALLVACLAVVGNVWLSVAAWANAGVPANPAGALGNYVFDLQMQVEIASDKVSGPITLYVNSHDGSMALANPHTTLWALGMPDIPELQIHHVIVRPGKSLVCGQHPTQGLACVWLGNTTSPLMMAWIGEEDMREYFASLAYTDPDNAPVDIAGTQGLAFVHGRNEAMVAKTFWFDPGRPTVSTQMPFLGPGVGIMRDLRSNTNRVVRYAFFDFHLADAPLSWLQLHLADMRRAVHRIDTGRYRLIDAFSSEAIAQSGDIASWMQAQGRQIQAWRRSLDTCPQGQVGSDCRAEYRAKIKRLEDLIRTRARAFASERGVSIPN